MFDWIGDLIDAIAEAIREAFEFLGTQISNTIWNTMLRWFYETIYEAVADFFTMMGNMGADIFALDWVQATIKLFTLFGWSLFVAGLVVAIFDVAIEYQHGRADIKTTSINILKGFFACSLIGVVPVELYKFCISLQNTFSHDLSALFASGQSIYNCASVNCRISGIDTSATMVGGIAGISNGGSIDNCYSASAVSGNQRVGGICGQLQLDATVTNCYNIGTVTGNSYLSGIVAVIVNNADGEDRKVENCYFNSDVFSGSGVIYLGKGTATNVEGKTTEQFKSGEVAYLLNLGVTDGSQVWYQDLGTDAAPQFDGGTVYLVKTGTCQELTLSYSNTAGDSYTDHPGYNEDGFCTLCGAPEKPELNTDGYYVIENAGNLFWFAGLVNGTLKDDPAQNVGAKAKLVTDVNISSYEWVPIGVSDAFTGVLDGGGHILTVNLSGERYMAPISFAHGATVRNLTVDGTITASGMNAAGIISWISGGDVVIENCLSSVDIVSSVNGDGTHGGLVGVINVGTLTINNCGFVGSITGDTTYSCGGLVGWAAMTTTIKNSYLAADFTLNTAHGSDSSNTFSRNPGQVRLYNCYYLNELKTTPNTATQMTQAQFESGEVTYKLNSGVTDGTQAWYQAIGTDKYPKLSGETVYPVGNCQDTGYSNVEAEYTDHSFGEKGICSVCGAFEPAKYVDGVYEISNVGQLFWFAEFVNAGNTKANAKLMADIDLKGYNWKPIGTYSDSDTTANAAYSGIFDGNYHVIENLSVKVETAHETGLFGRVNGGGTIKNLGVVNATVENTQGVRAGVIAGEIHNSTVTNVFTAGDITVTTTSAQAGGIAGECAGSVLTNCYTTYGCLTTNAGTVNNCYYMADEANSASKGTNLPESAFTSGELAYLLNGSTSEGELVWYQTIGTDVYPKFIGDIVYYDETADPQYFNTPAEIISVTITWTEMSFTYNKGTWNTETLTWDGGGWVADDGCGTVTVENTGTVDVNAEFAVNITDTDYAGYSVGFTTDGTALTDKKLNIPAGESKTVSVTLTGDEPTAYIEDKKTIGQITIVLSTE